MSKVSKKEVQLFLDLSDALYHWYLAHKRDLPWRLNKDPYKIWISEVMLQQTTVSAVIPYYERFLNRFPQLESLAMAPIEEVLKFWSGLGYYSRARNIHKAAQQISSFKSFPSDHQELIKLPGFGPYTSRAVASLAFQQAVGVVDGNVVRVLSRVLGWNEPWWTTQSRKKYQKVSDQLASHLDPSVINQGLMDLGAMVCTFQKPLCFLCPWKSKCWALENQQIQNLPTKKPRKTTEIWLWKPLLVFKNQKIALVKNEKIPFLRGEWIFPSENSKKINTKPKNYDFQHRITHHQIFVQIAKSTKGAFNKEPVLWVEKDNLNQINPSTLLKKVLIF